MRAHSLCNNRERNTKSRMFNNNRGFPTNSRFQSPNGYGNPHRPPPVPLAEPAWDNDRDWFAPTLTTGGPAWDDDSDWMAEATTAAPPADPYLNVGRTNRSIGIEAGGTPPPLVPNMRDLGLVREGEFANIIDGHDLQLVGNASKYEMTPTPLGLRSQTKLVFCIKSHMNPVGVGVCFDLLLQYHLDPNGGRRELQEKIDSGYATVGRRANGFGSTLTKIDHLATTLIVGKAAAQQFGFCFTESIQTLATWERIDPKFQVARLMVANAIYCFNVVDRRRQIFKMDALMAYNAKRSLRNLQQTLKQYGIWSHDGVQELCDRENNRKPSPLDVRGVFFPFVLLFDTLLPDDEWREIIPHEEPLMKITEDEKARFLDNRRIALLDDKMLKPVV